MKSNVIFVVAFFSSQASCAVHKWAGLENSYASGIGAVERVNGNDGAKVCSRYTEAYPNVMNIIIDASLPTDRIFHWPACSGPTTKSVMVSVIDVDSDIATLTVGGNDIGFGDTANACVFEVNCTPVCGETLTSTGNRIANDLPPRMDSLLIAIMNQTKSSGFKPYVTGYLHFWNVDTTQCDVVDFNFWADTPPSKLTRDLRTRINGLTQALNDQKNVLLAAHEAVPLHGGGNGAYALTPVSKLAKRTVAVEVLDEPVVTAVPKAMAFLA